MTIINNSLSLKSGNLFIENCDTVDLAKKFGTPLFVISEQHILHNLNQFRDAFKSFWPEGEVRIMPSIKASPILAVRQLLSNHNCGCDVFGPGELEGALRGGVEPENISVNGSIKDCTIIRRAIEIGARIVLDSPKELELCQKEAEKQDKKANVLFRIKPFLEELNIHSDFAPDFEIRELTQLIKYGIPTSELLPMGPRAQLLPNINPVGIHVHMGRHSKKLEVWESWVRHCILTSKVLSDLMGGWQPEIIDLGGGFPSFSDKDTDVYQHIDKDISIGDIAKTVTDTLRTTMQSVGFSTENVTIEIEPGRGLHGDTGIHLSMIKNIKEEKINRPRLWAELDTSEVFLGIPGLNEVPPFDIVFANKATTKHTITTDIVGMTCNAELLFMQVSAPKLEAGDLLAMLNTGAYSEPMAANFNSLPRPGTVLVSGDKAELVKRHETVSDVFHRDIVPTRLNTLNK